MRTKTIKISLHILFLLALILTFGCNKDPVSSEILEEDIPITQGVSGKVHFFEGSFAND